MWITSCVTLGTKLMSGIEKCINSREEEGLLSIWSSFGSLFLKKDMNKLDTVQIHAFKLGRMEQ